jgi:hypothetical protein
VVIAQEVIPPVTSSINAVWIALITTLGAVGTAAIFQLASLRKGQEKIATNVDGRMSGFMKTNKDLQIKIDKLEKIIVGMDKAKVTATARRKTTARRKVAR